MDTQDKRKNDDFSAGKRQFRIGIVVGVIGTFMVLVVGLLLSMVVSWAQMMNRPTSVESLEVPFDKAAASWTKYAYVGDVTITVSGVGQAGGEDYSDAFYLYTENGQPRQTPETHAFDLEIDGARAIIQLGLEDNPPPYNLDHIYTVTYAVGEQPHCIAFRTSDQYVADNKGMFFIEVSGTVANTCM